MGVHNPSGLYSENQGIFNSTPFTQFAIQQEAKRQAKDEALDKYYQGLPKSINSAGLRNQDTGGFIDKINGIRDFYAKNRDAIKNPRLDRGKAQAEYNARNTDASMYVNQSKAEELKKAPFVKILANPDMRDRVMDSDLQRLHQHDLPLNDPNRQSFDFGTIDFNPKELTPQETEAYQKSLTAGFQPSEKVVGSVPNAKDLTITNTYQKQWSPEQLKATADKDISNVTADRRLEYNAEQTWRRVSQDRDQFKQYNDIYKSIYGKDIQHPAELHAAMQVGGILGSSTRQEIKPDENARDKRNFEQQKQMQDRGFANARLLEGMREAHGEKLLGMREAAKAGGDDTNNVWIDNYLADIEDKGNPVGLLNKTGITQIIGAKSPKKIVPDETLRKALGNPDEIIVTPKGDYKITYYKLDSNKNPTDEVDATRSGLFTKDQVKLALGYKAAGKKQLTQEMQNSKKSTKKADPLGLGL